MKQRVSGCPALGHHVLLHRGQLQDIRKGIVVHADDREILRDPPIRLHSHRHQTDGDLVAGGNHCGRGGFAHEQRGCLPGGVLGGPIARDNPVAVHDQAVLAHALTESGQPAPGHESVFGVGRHSSGVADVGVTEVDQVVDRDPDGLGIVDVDQRMAGHGVADGDDRQTEFFDERDFFVSQGDIEGDQTIDAFAQHLGGQGPALES